MDRRNVQDEPESSWSETTAPASDDIEEIARYTPPPPRPTPGARPRLMRPPIRRRIKSKGFAENDEGSSQQANTYQMLDSRQSLDGSDMSLSPTITIVTSATSSCNDRWSSSSGYVEDEEEDDGQWDREDEVMEDQQRQVMEQRDQSYMEGRSDATSPTPLVIPKLEPEDDEVNMDDVKENILEDTLSTCSTPVTTKRPRGRPRKHPKINPEDKAKIAKNRSKTGCITCRRRKKKCDERKPECMNCEKNGVYCEGYQQKSMWKSGREKTEEARLRRVSLQTKALSPIITGVETPSDMLFFEHYIFRLSTIFTVEGEENNAFKDILLPMAVQHPGLMHSILALASKHINYSSPYGIKFLKDHPLVTLDALEKRSEFHNTEALAQLQRDIDVQCAGDNPDAELAAILAQILCQTLQTLSNPTPKGEHRLHLEGYQKIVNQNRPEGSAALRLIDELMVYHIFADELICLPERRGSLVIGPDDWNLPPIVQPDAVRLLGVSDGLFFYMSKITTLRNNIRTRMQEGIEPAVHCTALYHATYIDAGIREWTPAWPAGDPRDLAGALYRHMMWVYLYRTIYPLEAADWKVHQVLTDAVTNGIAILGQFGPRDPSQTLILAPAFVLGCAAFEQDQREEIRRAIAVVKAYMEYRNTDTALLVLEEVWRLMDAHDERSWDWQTIAHGMGLDFLAT